jgi:Domain of unknown function (DUF4224)
MSHSSPERRPRAAGGATAGFASLTLTTGEIVEITGYRRGHEQLRWFRSLGVPARRRPDGSVSVAREHYLRAGSSKAPTAAVEFEPRLNLD